MRKARASLIASVVIGLLAVTTAGVSTYAWFQASASSTINTNSSVTTISVSAPENTTLGSATLYKYNGNGDYGYTAAISSSATVASNFTDITGSNVTVTPAPGRKMTYCVKVSSTNSKNLTNGDLELMAYTSTNVTTRKVVTASSIVQDTIDEVTADRYIKIEEAINIYAHLSSDGTYGTASSTDKFAFDYEHPYPTSSTNLSLLPSDAKTVASATTSLYAFFTIEFSNTVLYKEYERISDVSYTDTLYNTPVDDSSTRYFFKPVSGGNSSCFEGLTFKITSLKLSAGAV